MHDSPEQPATGGTAPAFPATTIIPAELDPKPPFGTPEYRAWVVREQARIDAEARDTPEPKPFDLATFDPDNYEWRPVPRRPRADGWTPEVQRTFIETLADTGLVSKAAEAVDMSMQSAYRLRRAPGAEGFARAWASALDAAADALADVAYERATQGVEVPIFDRDGCRIGSKRQYNDRLVMFLLRAYRPERYRFAHCDTRGPDSPAPRREAPLAAALEHLTPPVPPAPHTSLPPEQLEHHVGVADALGEMIAAHPDWDRERYVRVQPEPSSDNALARREERAERDLRSGRARMWGPDSPLSKEDAREMLDERAAERPSSGPAQYDADDWRRYAAPQEAPDD